MKHSDEIFYFMMVSAFGADYSVSVWNFEETFKSRQGK